MAVCIKEYCVSSIILKLFPRWFDAVIACMRPLAIAVGGRDGRDIPLVRLRIRRPGSVPGLPAERRGFRDTGAYD